MKLTIRAKLAVALSGMALLFPVTGEANTIDECAIYASASPHRPNYIAGLAPRLGAPVPVSTMDVAQLPTDEPVGMLKSVNLDARLEFERVAISSGDTVGTLVESNGLLPDEHNIGFVAAINPDLTNPDQIQPGQKIWIPKNLGNQAVDGFAKEQIFRDVTGIQMLLLNNTSKDIMRFNKEIGAPELNVTIDQLLSNFSRKQIGFFSLAADDITLATRSSLYASAQIENIMTLRGLLDSQMITDEIYKNYIQSISYSVYAINTQPIDIVVRTRGEDGHPLENLEIYYVDEASYLLNCQEQNKERFDELSYEARHLLFPAYYRVWAEKDGQKSVSMPIELTFATDKTRIFDYKIEWID